MERFCEWKFPHFSKPFPKQCNLFFFEAALVPETPSLSYHGAEDPINEEDKDELVEEFANVLIDSFKSSDCGFHVFSDKDKNVKYEIQPDGVVASIETNIYPFVERLLEASCGFKVDMYPCIFTLSFCLRSIPVDPNVVC